LQAASGAGAAAMEELKQETQTVLEGGKVTPNIFPVQVSCTVDSTLTGWCLCTWAVLLGGGGGRPTPDLSR